jgi:hypothetical protein
MIPVQDRARAVCFRVLKRVTDGGVLRTRRGRVRAYGENGKRNGGIIPARLEFSLAQILKRRTTGRPRFIVENGRPIRELP